MKVKTIFVFIPILFVTLTILDQGYAQSAEDKPFLKWAFFLGVNQLSSHYVPATTPAIGPDGTVYIGFRGGILYAINPDGSQKWGFQTDGEIVTSPAIAPDGTIYIGSRYKVFALLSDGTLKWSMDSSQTTEFAIGRDGTIYIGINEAMYALSPDKVVLWRYGGSSGWGDSLGSPSVDLNGNIIFTIERNYDDYIVSLPPSKTDWESPNLWRIKMHTTTVLPGTIGEENVAYFCAAIETSNKKLYGIKNGSIVREFTDTACRVPFIGHNETIYTMYSGQTLHVINKDVTKKYILENQSESSQNLTIGAIDKSGIVYLYGTENSPRYDRKPGSIWAIHPNGTLKWFFEVGTGYLSPLKIGPNGITYIVSEDGHLYAIESGSDGLADSAWPTTRHDNQNSGNSQTPLLYNSSFEAKGMPWLLMPLLLDD